MRIRHQAAVALTIAILPVTAHAQKIGAGGTGIDETTELPKCSAPIGTIALVESKAPSMDDELPPGMRALVRMAESQNGGSAARVDPLPLLKLLTAQSNCFQVVERGNAYDALQRERALAMGNAPGTAQPVLQAADYLLSAQVLYSDANSRGASAGIGGAFGSAVGLKTKTLESQIMLSLINVKTGVQEAVATGAARKKDTKIIGGGLLLDLGIGALGGAYTSTDIGKVTSLAMLDAYRKIATTAKLRQEAARAESTQGPMIDQTVAHTVNGTTQDQ
ncbi:hypothetical protein HT136_22330 [Novosphingobium profundi]|uniref:CsgG/HfaB family protein n=1 Tax=Novosphingobium profundi TaxID=1774954 RepID=UPI001BDAF88B|nr:CsgG/HfaB family protein [Novosphingobium profundi]MBT0671114.1 hypothetical protein [Novosphingobium profundi]